MAGLLSVHGVRVTRSTGSSYHEMRPVDTARTGCRGTDLAALG
jgi:hypothetical protein